MNKREIFGQVIYGLEVSKTTGCVHYHGSLDIVAIKLRCCQRYYSCYLCHDALEDHPIQKWDKSGEEKVVFCGMCGHEMTLPQYLQCNHHCARCKSAFNPGCQKHRSHYFQSHTCDL